MRNLAKAFFVSVVAIGLLGCGSSTPITPQAATGFAKPDDEIRRRVTFDLSEVTTFLAQDGAGGLVQQDLKLRVNAQGNPIIVLDGVKYVLNNEGNGIFSTLADDTDILYIRTALTDPNVVETIYLSLETDDSFNAAFLPFGFDTNPNVIAQATGSATFEGPAQLSLRQVVDGELNSGFSTGTARITANFNANSVNGTIRYDNAQERPLVLPDITLRLETSAVRGNRFGGDISIARGDIGPGLSLSEAAYDGRFYGADADAVAGTLTGRIETGDAESPIFVQGAFLGE